MEKRLFNNEIILETPNRIKEPLGWVEHIPFAFFLLEMLKPNIFVELGVHTGNSYFSFCQAVKKIGCGTRCFGIDSWKGDKHSGFYDKRTYEDVLNYNQKNYANFSVLLKKYFDDASADFKEQSIDLLHIDGMHTYEAVKHDFETWLPKMSKKGVVILHDTVTRLNDFGVWRLWDELQNKYPSFNFTHNYGLGVLAVGNNVDEKFLESMDMLKNSRFNKKLFEKLGVGILNDKLADIKNTELSAVQDELIKKDAELSSAYNDIADLNAISISRDLLLNQLKENFIKKESKITELNNALNFKDLKTQQLSDNFNRKEKELQEWKKLELAKEEYIKGLERSLTFKLLKVYQRLLDFILPEWFFLRGFYNRIIRFNQILINGDFIKNVVKNKLNSSSNIKETEQPYYLWIKNNEPKLEDFLGLQKEISFLPYKPLISIVMPTYNIDEVYLRAAIESVRRQLYPNWELCVADDGSTEPAVKKILEEYRRRDKRIKIIYLAKNQGTSGASNAALSLATGEFVGLLDHDDELTPWALLEIVKLLNHNQKLDFIYSDEDKLELDGSRSEPFFKPDFSPDLLLSMNYITHFSVFRQKLLNQIGGFRKGFEGSQDYDLLLRYLEKGNKVYHIPKILYHWRKIPGSVAENFSFKNYAWESGRRALEDALIRRKIKGDVVLGKNPGVYRVKRKIIGNPKVSIIIPFKDKGELLEKCVDSILKKSTYKNFEIILISNNSEEKKTSEVIDDLRNDKRVKFYEYNIPFNYSKINNYGVSLSEGEHVLLLNNDTEVINSDWIECLLEHSQRPEIGAVGAKLYYKDDRIQHAGIIIGIQGIARHSHKGLSRDDSGYISRVVMIQNISAVTGACLMIKRDLYEKMGGLDEKNLKIAFNDVDFCLRLREAGYLNVFTPYAELYHYESVSRGLDDSPRKIEMGLREFDYIKKRHKKIWEQGDPYYNPNLSLEFEDFRVK